MFDAERLVWKTSTEIILKFVPIPSTTSVVVLCGVWLSLCVCVRLASRVFVCLASACICLACVLRLSASVHVKGSECVRLRLVRLASVVLSRVCVCLASASVSRLRLSRVCLSLLVNACGNWLILCRSSFKRFFAIVILSYNVPMPKYPSHHLIYVFYHPMPIMPLY